MGLSTSRLSVLAALCLCVSGCGSSSSTSHGSSASCAPSCAGKACGDDGCGGTCGTCAAGASCSSAGQCTGGSCTPACSGKACGDDGCGGTCGTCAAIQGCNAGQCVWPARTFAADVYPIILGQGCGTSSCHGGAAPAQGLDMSSEARADADLVGVPSAECAAKDRVAAGDLAGSYLVNKITGTGLCAGSRMPLGGELSEGEIETIEAWIATGAKP